MMTRMQRDMEIPVHTWFTCKKLNVSKNCSKLGAYHAFLINFQNQQGREKNHGTI